jgi:hypothetical protein
MVEVCPDWENSILCYFCTELILKTLQVVQWDEMFCISLMVLQSLLHIPVCDCDQMQSTWIINIYIFCETRLKCNVKHGIAISYSICISICIIFEEGCNCNFNFPVWFWWNSRVIQKVTSSELLTKEAMRKNIYYILIYLSYFSTKSPPQSTYLLH